MNECLGCGHLRRGTLRLPIQSARCSKLLFLLELGYTGKIEDKPLDRIFAHQPILPCERPWVCSGRYAARLHLTSVSEIDGLSLQKGEDVLENRPYDPDWLPLGFYGALENPISEEEHWRPVEWEEEHDVPYAIAMQWEQEHGTPCAAATEENLSLEERQAGGLSIITYASDQCCGERLRHVTQQNTCYTSTNGVSLYVKGSRATATW